MTAFTPCRLHSPLDRFNLFLRNWFVNRLLFQTLFSGFLFYPGIFFEKLPRPRSLDFLGVNYYTRNFIRFAGFLGTHQFGTVCPNDHHSREIGEVNDLGWEIYPPGIYQVVSPLRSFGLPVIITENGVCTKDDAVRQRYIEGHLAQLERARREGISIFGYFYWSLVDNFEWAEGFVPRFGIVDVDYSTQARRVRPSAETLRKGCEKIFNAA
jgi:beta-glucosidase